MQPTTLCNLNCTYCYLTNRDKNQKMSEIVSQNVAQGLSGVTSPVEIVWHGGEPLSCGITHFSELMEPFSSLQEKGIISWGIQTNGTLINERWIEIFTKNKFRVGVSLDGPDWANLSRLNWKGGEVFNNIMRGINILKSSGVPFSIICVVNKENLSKAKELYQFFSQIGCQSLGINIEEQLGVHKPNQLCDDLAVKKFWSDIFVEWQRNPVIHMRDLDRMMTSLIGVTSSEEVKVPEVFDIFPSVSHTGDVVLLAPEFLNTKHHPYNDFVVGNVLKQDFLEIVENGKSALYVEEFLTGVHRCGNECEYFYVCYGGQAGNKFFESGTTNVTETAFCRHSEKMLAEAILDSFEN